MKLDLELAELVERVTAHYSRRCWWADPADIRGFRVAVLLNVTPDHLDRHGDNPIIRPVTGVEMWIKSRIFTYWKYVWK